MGNAFLLRQRKLWIHGQGQHFLSCRLGVGKRARCVTQVCISRLEMDGDGVVNASMNATRLQDGLQRLASLCSDGIDVIDMTAVRRDIRHFDGRSGEKLIIPRGMRSVLDCVIVNLTSIRLRLLPDRIPHASCAREREP